MRLPDRRSEDPADQPRLWLQRRMGVRDQQDTGRSLLALERYADRAILEAQPIAWEAPTSSDQAVTTTTYTLITGSDFRVSLAGPNAASWLVDVTYRAIVQSMGAIDQDAVGCVLVDWQDTGTWVKPDVDRDTTHGRAQAWAIADHAESAVTGSAFSLNSRAVFKVRGGSTFGIAFGVYVGSGHTATINLTNTDRVPSCVGMAVPCFGV